MIIFPAELDIMRRWRECEDRNSVMCWRALSHVLLAYARIEFHEDRFEVANDLLTLSEVSQGRAILLAPFEDVP